ncbi:Hypothetical protein, putative [Bodo saltans]|uniref:Uncharacterized protein n=1 Tax=Bodo saltans TaxID=75058 RepID=A0A0S4J0I6_BODSA|nr:Hypothetical protein, putative [Bodo saltans]|eukprot:CUG76947.1 Hypothetical protein, putative [Bodo saltans]
MLHVKLLLEGCGVLASSRVSALDVTFHELTTLPPEWSAFPSATNISMRLIMEASMESLDEATAHLNSTLPSRFAAAPLPAKWWKARDIDVKPSSLTQTDIDEMRQIMRSYFVAYPPTTTAQIELQEHCQGAPGTGCEEGFTEAMFRMVAEQQSCTVQELIERFPRSRPPAPLDENTDGRDGRGTQS